MVAAFFLICGIVISGADDERALFNGKDLTGWQGMQGPPTNWGVKKGALTCTGGKGAQWLATREEFSDFDLSLESVSYTHLTLPVSYTHLTLPTNREV